MFGVFGVHLSTRRAEKREKRKTKRTKNRERPAGARSSPPQVGEEGKAVARELVREEGDLKKATDVGATEVENAINEEKKEQATGVTENVGGMEGVLSALKGTEGAADEAIANLAGKTSKQFEFYENEAAAFAEDMKEKLEHLNATVVDLRTPVNNFE